MTKTILLTFFSLCLVACGSISSSKYIKVLTTTKNVIYGGVSGTPITHHLVSNVVVKKSGFIKCDSFWSDGYTGLGRILDKDNNSVISRRVSKGEQLTIDFYYFVLPPPENPDNPPVNGSTGSVLSKPPVIHPGELLFRYSFDKKTKYLSLSNLKITEPIFGQ